MTWTNEALTPYAKAHEAHAAGIDYRIGSAPVTGWQAGFLELATELLKLRARFAPRPEDLAGLETIWQPKLQCPSCAHRLEPMESAPPETTGVCPSCGELVRSFALAVEASERGAACPACSTLVRTYLAVRIYTDEEADANAHPEVLAKLRGIQDQIRSANIDVDVPASQVTRSDAAITCACEFEDPLACQVDRDGTPPETSAPCGCPCHGTPA